MKQPEWLSLVCCRPPDEAVARQIQRLEAVEGAAWVEDALREHLGPLLYWKLTSLVPPVPVPASIRCAFWTGVAKAEVQSEWLGKILGALNGAGIGAAPLKGCWLSEAVYPHPALRPHAALDLLVSLEDLQIADEGLRGLGLRKVNALAKPSMPRLAEYRHPAGRISCILHTSLEASAAALPAGAPSPDGKDLLALARPERGGCGRYLDLPAHVHFLHLLGQLARPRHPLRPLLRIVDLSWVLGRYGSEIAGEALELGRSWGIDLLGEAALCAVCDILGADLLPGIERPSFGKGLPAAFRVHLARRGGLWSVLRVLGALTRRRSRAARRRPESARCAP